MSRRKTNEHGGHERPCDGCALVDRRNFLRDASLLAAGVLVTLGATPRHASAAPMGLTSAREAAGEDKSYPIPAADGTQIDKDNSVIVARWQDKVYVFSLACPHQNTAIRWHDKEHEFECPKHHSRYLADGAYVKDSGRATRGLDRFAVRRDGNNVVADLDKLYREDEDETPWKSAFIAL
jgi:nitrite reductase/ring-hydroxylating ferredoxin subunit